MYTNQPVCTPSVRFSSAARLLEHIPEKLQQVHRPRAPAAQAQPVPQPQPPSQSRVAAVVAAVVDEPSDASGDESEDLVDDAMLGELGF